MRHHGYQSYFDNEVLAATPVKLIEMLYAAALDSIAAARRHVRHKDIPARTRAINKALRIVTELSRSLNHDGGGEIARNLSGLYAYVVRLLVEANIKQDEAPLVEAEGLLAVLAEAWKTCTPRLPESEFSNSELLARDVHPVGDFASVAR